VVTRTEDGKNPAPPRVEKAGWMMPAAAVRSGPAVDSRHQMLLSTPACRPAWMLRSAKKGATCTRMQGSRGHDSGSAGQAVQDRIGGVGVMHLG